MTRRNRRQVAPARSDAASGRDRSWLEARGDEPVFETATAALMPPNPKRRLADKGELVTRVDLIVVLGGDGTLLSVAGCIASADVDVPILGVNFGSLGFLTEATLPELYPSLEAALAGRAKVEARMMLRATTIRQRRALPEQLALNDVVITKSARARMTDLSVSLGEEFVDTREGGWAHRRHAHGIDRLQPVGRRSDRPAGGRRAGVDADCAAHAHQPSDRHSGVVARCGCSRS